MRAHDVDDRVGLADVGEEAVAEPLAAVRAGDEAGDVVEVDRVVHDVARVQELGEPFEPLIGDGDDGDVRLDRGERGVGGLRPGGELSIPGGAASQPIALPSSAPASTSEG